MRRWLPEIGTPAYHRAIVDEWASLAEIKARLNALRQSGEARSEADDVH